MLFALTAYILQDEKCLLLSQGKPALAARTNTHFLFYAEIDLFEGQFKPKSDANENLNIHLTYTF